jgi:8-amino-3,8-dideoxy-alpha-D-manno-octulosonate transaminase
MYHYINQWDHVKKMSYPAPLTIHELGPPQDYHQMKLPRSENLMSRMGSVGIRCTWKENELEMFADKLVKSITKVI